MLEVKLENHCSQPMQKELVTLLAVSQQAGWALPACTEPQTVCAGETQGRPPQGAHFPMALLGWKEPE